MQIFHVLLLSSVLAFTVQTANSQNKNLYPLKMIINEMTANDVYERSNTVGYAGTGSKQLELYKKLAMQASENDLIELASTHQSAVVRLYAFQALKQKAKVIPESLEMKFETDSTEVITLTGCLGNIKTVRSVAFEPIIRR